MQEALHSSGSGSSSTTIQGSRSGPVVASPIDSICRGCFIYVKISNLAKNSPRCLIGAASISVMIGRDSTKGVRGRGIRAHKGGHRATIPVRVRS